MGTASFQVICDMLCWVTWHQQKKKKKTIVGLLSNVQDLKNTNTHCYLSKTSTGEGWMDSCLSEMYLRGMKTVPADIWKKMIRRFYSQCHMQPNLCYFLSQSSLHGTHFSAWPAHQVIIYTFISFLFSPIDSSTFRKCKVLMERGWLFFLQLDSAVLPFRFGFLDCWTCGKRSRPLMICGSHQTDSS